MRLDKDRHWHGSAWYSPTALTGHSLAHTLMIRRLGRVERWIRPPAPVAGPAVNSEPSHLRAELDRAEFGADHLRYAVGRPGTLATHISAPASAPGWIRNSPVFCSTWPDMAAGI